MTKINMRKTVQTVIEVDIQYPLFRKEHVDDNHNVYWKFDSANKVTKITDKISEMSILTYDDKRADFLSDFMNEDMLNGEGQYSILPERGFDLCLQRLIDLIHRS